MNYNGAASAERLGTHGEITLLSDRIPRAARFPGNKTEMDVA